MIEIIVTVDYEIYGNGTGSLRDLIYEPTEKLRTIFKKWNAPWVAFIEAAELEAFSTARTDPAIDLVERQVSELYRDGAEIGLHLHPQWYNARRTGTAWHPDYSEYNLCFLPPDRIDEIVGRSISYLRRTLGEPGFVPLSFRAGNWLLQPTAAAARSLSEHGIRVDSSVFKGGLQRDRGLDYRRSRKNGYYWMFSEDVNIPDPHGRLLELPTYTRMVPIWQMITAKRLSLQRKGTDQQRSNKLARMREFARLLHPMKLDFCRQTAEQMIKMIEFEMMKDQKERDVYRPLVAIGHTKDLVETDTLEFFITHLQNASIPVVGFRSVYDKALKTGASE